ncbi:hypothetical protein F4679DRAFT_520037 [Xylaria curta]|nr:hypothetical protein F4679DRAFT_520037 [Xylaria curta]
MAEMVGLVLATVSVSDPLIKAIQGLRRVYRATKGTSDSLIRLEHTGDTVHLYLSKVDDSIKRNLSECTLDFI